MLLTCLEMQGHYLVSCTVVFSSALFVDFFVAIMSKLCDFVGSLRSDAVESLEIRNMAFCL